MSDFFLADRIKEVAYDPAGLDFQLAGAVNGFSGFGDFLASGDVVYYAATDGTRYEVGSGVYKPDASSRVLTRNPFRSSNINVGPWYVNATSNSGPTDGTNGYFYPLWLTRSAAESGVGFTDGPYTAVMEHTFDEIPGVTFYMPTEHQAHGVGSLASSGANYYDPGQPSTQSGVPVTMIGTTEIFVTYPGKTAVFNTNGIDSTSTNAKQSGVAFWLNENVVSYDAKFIWDQVNSRLGIDNSSPTYAVDVGGDINYSVIRASGFVDGGSGVKFSGGAMTYTGATASGGVQLEPFLRNEIGNNAADGVIALSGDVGQYIDFEKQPPATIFAGPISGYCGGSSSPCNPDFPTFRLIDVGDLPLTEIREQGGFVTQENAGIDLAENFPFRVGQVALYESSGYISYASGLFYNAGTDRLGIGGTVSVIDPQYTLDVSGVARAASGIFNRVLYLDNNIRIGEAAGNDNESETANVNQIALGSSAGLTSSGTQENVFIASFAGYGVDHSSGVVAIGSGAARDALFNRNIVLIGDSAGLGVSGVSGVFGAGSRVLAITKNLDDVVALGTLAGSGSAQGESIVAIGRNAFVSASGSSSVVAIGENAAKGASGVVMTNVIGDGSASGSFDLTIVNALGDLSAVESSGLTQSTFIGQAAGRYAETLDNVIALGRFAAQSGLELERTVAIGGLAASQASGSFNVYIGQDAGIAVSGYENIEIVASGSNESFLGVEASGKVNIGEVITADIYNHKVAVGNPLDASPSGTLFVAPKEFDDEAFVIQHKDQGSDAVPYVLLKSGDATTFFSISNSGDVITSGCVEPSGGLLLPSITPTDWMNNTTNRLYNDAGTLKFNGTALSTGGGFSSFDLRAQIDNTADSGVEITTGQTILFSGIHVDTQIDSGNRQIIVDAGELSGVLQGQITASNYQFGIATSGEEGAGRNVIKDMFKDSVLLMSGVSGVGIDFINEDDGTNSSGVFVIGYDPAASYNWSITNGGKPAESVLTTETVTISGVSGVGISFNPGSIFFEIGAGELSGVLQNQIDSNVSFLSNENGPILVSGVSGIAAYASGQVDLISQNSATSGLILQDDQYIMDPQGSGNLAALFMGDNIRILANDNGGSEILNSIPSAGTGIIMIGSTAGSGAQNPGGSVIIGEGADTNTHKESTAIPRPDRVSIGVFAGAGCSGDSTDYSVRTVNIGKNAGRDCWNAIYNVNIGYEAGSQSSNGSLDHSNVMIGAYTGKGGAEIRQGVFVGKSAGYASSGCLESNMIGDEAGYNSKEIDYSNFIGSKAGFGAVNVYGTHIVGNLAGSDCRDLNSVVFFGDNAGYQASGLVNSTFVGNRAGYRASGVAGSTRESLIGIGDQALYQSVDNQQVVAIGDNAGYAVSGANHSVLLGRAAGWKRSGQTSIIISDKSALPTNYDLEEWTAHDDVNILSIGDVIQGDMTDDDTIIHLGRKLDSTEDFAGKAARDRDLDGLGALASTVAISASKKEQSALILLPNSNSSVPGQNSPLLKTLPSDSTNNGNSGLGLFNAIISAEGWLQIAEGTSWDNANKELSTDAGQIEKVDGAMAVANGTIFGASAGANLVVYFNGQWHRIALTSL
tara:strand:+ start:1214 stop:5983 length:4770 start_codon:yes stop_codon:yes gene_type:complete